MRYIKKDYSKLVDVRALQRIVDDLRREIESLKARVAKLEE